MASIDITTQSGAVGNGDLQLQNGAPMDATLRFVTDALNTASPLKLSTSLVQTTSTLKITTNDNPYIDAEDGTGNNRFTVGRAPASQQVNVDFASNPTGSTTAVGAIRTFRDGTNLSEAMTFIEDGSVGIGTTAPVGLLDLYKAAAATRLAIRGDAGQNRLISYRTGALQRFGLYVNNTAESGSNVGSDFAIRAYNDAGTLLSTPLFIKRSTGNVGIGTTTPERALNIVSNSPQIRISDTTNPSTNFWEIQSVFANTNQDFFIGNQVGTALAITSAGNVGIGTTSPTQKLDVSGSPAIGINVASSASQAFMNFTSVNTAGFEPFIAFGGTTAGDQSQMIGIVNGGVRWTTAGTEKMRITSDGYLRLTAASGGIQFNGDTAAANALDDYEEGTWTPTFSGATTAGNYTYSGGGSYTKIGNQVTAWCTMIDITEVSAGTGDWKVSGLPFTISNNNSLQRLCSTIWVRQALNTRNNLLAIPSAGTTNVFPLYDNQASGGGNAFTIAGDFQNNMDIGFTTTYFV